MDSENAPTRIEGYQIKTKENGNWTINSFTKRESSSGKPDSLLPSILGKMYVLKLQFPAEAKLLQFVSNAPLKAKLKFDGKSQTKSHLLFDELLDAVQSQVGESLKQELELSDTPSLSGLFKFEVTEVPLKGHETYTKGKLADFLHEIYPERPFRVASIYRALLGEVAARNNNHEPLHKYEDLIRVKSISRIRFSDILAEVGVTPLELKWETVEARLNSEHASLAFIQGLRREWDGVELDRISRAEVIHLRLWEIIAKLCGAIPSVAILADAIESVYSELFAEIDKEWPFSEAYIKAAIVMGIYEHK